jgi:hypothetical protein
MKWIILVVVLALSVGTATAKKLDMDTTRDVLHVYDMSTLSDRQALEAIVGWMRDGILAANVMLRNRKQPLIYCPPEKLTITNRQMIDMVRKEIKEKPQLDDLPVVVVVLWALKDTFPCKE